MTESSATEESSTVPESSTTEESTTVPNLQQKNQQHLRLQHHQQIKVLIQETAQEVVLRLQR